MHIPDGFLDLRTAATAGGLALVGAGLALRDLRRRLPPRRVPLVGLSAAFVFAAQMLNFPVAAGTSGHLVGGVLVAVLLGPAAAVVVMTAVLLLQCLMFADGGITALGANVLNMGLIAPASGFAIYAALRRLGGGTLRATLLATGFAAWCSIVIAAIACAAELAASGTVAWRQGLPAICGVHMLIGFGEAAISMLIVAVVARSRPELLAPEGSGSAPRRATVAYGLFATLALVVFVAPVASSSPDGLERVAERLGFAGRALAHDAAPLAGYSLSGFSAAPAPLALVIAGAIGTIAAFLAAWLLARVLAPAVPRPQPR
ncbi:MAG TPA: energy-coupling factor ABC transporter permease [Steroidobacteraceae bacterium]|nr:energy-coupling factor ABC transporter permease [Steroidobacteraceae bacterium]